MSRSNKIILGILSFLPFVILIFYISAIFTYVIEMMKISQTSDKPVAIYMWTRMAGVLVWALVLAFLVLGLKIYYIIHAINNKLIDQTEKIVWVMVFIFFGIVGYPAYWVSRIWNTPNKPTTSS